MSNRLLGILILLICIFSGIAFYLYAFVTYTGTIVINTNVENYTVELDNKKTFKKSEQPCSEKRCEILEVSPFDYTVTIKKENYKSYIEKISVKRSEVKSLVFVLEKDTKLTAVDTVGEESSKDNTRSESSLTGALDEKDIILSKKEKLKRLENKRKYYSYFEIQNFGEIYFKIENDRVNMYFKDELGKEKVISHFNKKAEKFQIAVQKVHGIDYMVVIVYGEETFLYDAYTANLQKLSLQIPILYVKEGIEKSLQFKTKKGTFIYKNKKFEYFSMFEDFVYINGNYIGFIAEDDKRRKYNLNFEEESGNLVVLHNPQTKEKRILLKPNFSVEKIILQDAGVVLEDGEGKEFILENY